MKLFYFQWNEEYTLIILSYGAVDCRFNFINFILLKQVSYDAVYFDNVNRMWNDIAKFLSGFSSIEEIYLNSPFGEEFSFHLFGCCFLEENDVPIALREF